MQWRKSRQEGVEALNLLISMSLKILKKTSRLTSQASVIQRNGKYKALNVGEEIF
jgi:hypothetical protein